MRGLALGLCLITFAGCGGGVQGSFDGVDFAPTGTALAVVDRHTFITLRGVTQAVQRPEAQRSVVLLLTGALADPLAQWSRLSAPEQLDLRKGAATQDGVLLRLPLSEVTAGATLAFTLDGPQDSTDPAAPDAPVRAAYVVTGLPSSDAVAQQGLGSEVSVTVTMDTAELTPGERFSGEVVVKRDRAADQREGVAIGEVSIPFSVRFAAERRGKSNLALLAPVLRCAAQAGPVRAPGCKDAPADPEVDATSTLLGP